MCGKALPVGTDWESFSVEKSATFQQFPPGFQQISWEKQKRSVEKRFFYRKTVWKTRVKLWNTHFLPKNLWKTTRFSSAAPQTEERCL